ncbi:hypothetical protein FW800_26865 [Pseudomonas sp. 910_23]|uniref:hypothetical protein n=1 Tax=unclassified Pseudomonas TaxID=196821 RepID=UPI001E59C7A7|nr:hypothetical protein [Pseudomonas sp. HN8-3]UEH09627.1 hypothetical protein LJX92_05880 [Pseudomonas sp. HN8-3]
MSINLDHLKKIVTPADIKRAAERTLALQYLQSTDWQVIADYERKRPIPDEVQAKRKNALDIVTAELVTDT